MIFLVIAVILTLVMSAFCSLLEAMVLSVSTAEIEELKNRHEKRGGLLELFKDDIEGTTSAILALNTIANTLGSVLVGGLATGIFGENVLLTVSVSMTTSILLFSEVIPKNVGVLYRSSLVEYFIYPLYVVRLVMVPLSFLCRKLIRLLLNPKEVVEDPDKEITLLVEKGAKEGQLTKDERDMVSNALSLDDISVYSIMTPRPVIGVVDRGLTVGELLKREGGRILFARMPVIGENLDDIRGMIRRRDILGAEEDVRVEDLMQEVTFIPETASGADALEHFLKKQQQFSVVVDEFGVTVGVLTMEDVFEYILGKEIYEKDDVAVDMRALALKKKELKERRI